MANQKNIAQADRAAAREALKQLRAPIEQARAEREARIAARRAAHAARAREAHRRVMAGFAPEPMTFAKLARKHARAD